LGDRLFIVLGWDTSRTAARMGGIRFNWDDETGWAYSLHGLSLRTGLSRPLTVLHWVYAAPEDVAAVGEQFVCHWRLPTGEYGAEWDGASQVRATIDRFRATLQDPDGLWTGSGWPRAPRSLASWRTGRAITCSAQRGRASTGQPGAQPGDGLPDALWRVGTSVQTLT
jgi:hypothetical protein